MAQLVSYLPCRDKDSSKYPQFNMVTHACDPSPEETEARGFLELTDQQSFVKSLSFGFSERPYLKR